MQIPIGPRADFGETAPPPTRWRRFRPGRSIRNRVLAIALIPCVALLITGTVAVVGLANEARAANRWSEYLNKQLDPLVGFVQATQDERAASLAALSGAPQSTADLQARRAQMDTAVASLARLVPETQKLNARGVAESNPAFTDFAARLPATRQAVDTREANSSDVDDFYTGLAGIVALGFAGLARSMPDSSTAAEEMTAADLMQVSDAHSRASGVAGAAISGGTLRPEERRLIAQLAGAYRNQLRGLQSRLPVEGRARVRSLTDSTEWNTAVRAEDELAEWGTLPIPFADWQAAERAVNTDLLGAFRDHARYANRLAADAAHQSLTRSIAAGAAVAMVSLCAFLLALVLADRLVRRLGSLRSRSLQMANETLPSIVRRLHDGEQVDIEAETMMTESRTDEIGQVAAAFAAAQRTAMTAAAAEARTRAGFNRVFLDIAYRSQVLVRRQLDVLDIAEAKQNDPEHLELLFQLDHLATRARRNAENLLILGGASPARRWREPISLEQIVRSAASETQDLARVSAIRLPVAQVLGNAVADLIHLLAELIENATLFSPPQAPVSVHGHHVGKGVVVEIEDQGLGIRVEERERLNAQLRDPSDFQEMALAGQRHLGLFVVGQLARRNSITVNLQESAYGGVKAIVLIPALLLATTGKPDGPIDASGVAELPVHSSRGPRPWLDSLSGLRPSVAEHPQLPPSSADQVAQFDEIDRLGGDPASAIPRGGSASLRSRTASRKRAPLPQRQRQTHLAPQLQLDDPVSGLPLEIPADDRRTAEEMRSSLSSFQRGTRQARAFNPHIDQ